MGIIHLLTGFEGRIRRRTFWFGALCLIALAIVFMAIVLTLGLTLDNSLIWVLYVIVFVYPSCAIYAKRLHDRDKAALPWLVIFMGPSVLTVLAQAAGIGFVATQIDGQMTTVPSGPVGWLLVALSTVVGLWALIELGFLAGTPGPNRFGPDPKGGAAPAPAEPA